MLEFNKYVGTSLEDAKENCMNENNLREEDMVIKYDENQTGDEFVIYALDKLDIRDFIKDFFKNLSKLMNIDIEVEVSLRNDVYNVVLATTNSSILIGKDGRTLDAMQMLLKQILKNLTDVNFKVILDVSGYKQKKARNFEFEIRKIAKEVMNTKIPVTLDPMNSYDRRIVHTIIGDFPKLETYSTGEGIERAVNIVYKEEE